MEKITAILLSWQRPNNLPIILDSLYSTELVDEIILWNNNPDSTLAHEHPKLKVINSPHNYGTLTRFCVAGLAQNQNILFHDDDLCLTKEQIGILFREYSKDVERLYGPFGRNLERGQYKFTADFDSGDVDIMLGRIILFNKKHLHNFFTYLGSWKDSLEDDILFSFSMNTKHRVVDIGTVHELDQSHALSYRPDHRERRQAMVDYCLDTIPGLRERLANIKPYV